METRHALSPEDRLSIGESARIVGVSVDTLRRWADSGQVPFERRSTSKHRVFRRADIDAINQPVVPTAEAS